MIVETNDLKYLSKSEITDDKAIIIWENITKENEKQNGGNTYGVLLNLFQGLGELLSEYNEVRITLWALMKKYDTSLVESMRDKGFNIDDTNSDTYRESLFRCFARMRNYETRIKMQRNNIELEIPNPDEKKQQVSFEDLIANLTINLKFNLPTDITLSMFNAYHKQIRDGRARGANNQE